MPKNVPIRRWKRLIQEGRRSKGQTERRAKRGLRRGKDMVATLPDRRTKEVDGLTATRARFEADFAVIVSVDMHWSW